MGKLFSIQQAANSFSLAQSETNLARQLVDDHYRKWLNKIPEFGPLSDVVNKALTNEIGRARETYAKNKSVISLEFDIGVIQTILTRINDLSIKDIPKQFVLHVQQTLSGYVETTQDLVNQVHDVEGEFKQRVQNIAQRVIQTLQEFNFAITAVSNFKNVIKFIADTVDAISKVKANPKEIEAIARKLFGSLEEGMQIQQTVGDLQKQLEVLKQNPVLNETLIKQKTEELAEAIKHNQIFTNTLNTINQGFQLVGIVASLTGDTKFAQTVNKVGTAVVTIISTIAALSAASGPFAPFVAIGSGILSIFHLFTSGPSESELIIDHINKLADHLDKRFDAIENTLFAISARMDKRFDRLEAMLGSFYKEVISNFIDLRQRINNLQYTAYQIIEQITLLGQQMEAGFRTLYKQSYEAEKHRALRFHEDRSYPKEMPQEDMLHHYENFRDWILDGVKDSLLSGDGKKIYTYEELFQEIRRQGIDYIINPFAQYMVREFNIRSPGILCNPLAWADGVLTFIEFIKRTPEFVILPEHHRRIDDFIAVGSQVNHFTKSIRANEQFFSTLIEDYAKKYTTIPASLLMSMLDRSYTNELIAFLFKAKKYSQNYLIKSITSPPFPDTKRAIEEALIANNFNLDELVGLFNKEKPIPEEVLRIDELMWKLGDINNSLRGHWNFLSTAGGVIIIDGRSCVIQRKFEELKIDGLWEIWLKSMGGIYFSPFDTIRCTNLTLGLVNELEVALRENKPVNKNLMEYLYTFIETRDLIWHSTYHNYIITDEPIKYIRKTINDSFGDLLTNSSYFKQTLKSLNAACNKLIFFTALAFSNEYNDPQSKLTSILLLNLKDDQDYIKKVKQICSSDESLENFSRKLLPSLYDVSDINQLLTFFTKVTQDAANKLKARQPVPGYQLIDDTIEKLQLFKSMYPATSLELLADTKNLIRDNKLHNSNTPFWKKSLQQNKLLADDQSEAITIKAKL